MNELKLLACWFPLALNHLKKGQSTGAWGSDRKGAAPLLNSTCWWESHKGFPLLKSIAVIEG